MKRARLLVIALVCLTAVPMLAGGPILVGGPAIGGRPAFGTDGQPFTWDLAKMPISYRIDPGPLAMSGATTVISNATGVQRVQNMFNVWQAVPTAKLSFSNAGALLAAGSYTGGDLTTVQQYNDVMGSCKSGAQNPVIFDAGGLLMSDLGLPTEVLGFTTGCALDQTTGHLSNAAIVLNGKWQAGGAGYQMTVNEFNEVIAHEIGHFIGLDHSQINLDLLTQYAFPCSVDGLAGMPLMFPEALCQARVDAGLPILSPDDVAWVSALYPGGTLAGSYGTISGTIYFSDGVSQLQGANVIARAVDDPDTAADESRRIAVSAISGFLFTGNPGQSVTASMLDTKENNQYGSPIGSRNPNLIGYYEIHVPPGTYTVEVESVYQSFVSDSGVGPLSPPIPLPGPAEFWKKQESAFDFPLQRDTITVHAGDKITRIDIILNGTPPRFDQFEDNGARLDSPLIVPLRTSSEVGA